jgi:hypothetical protein
MDGTKVSAYLPHSLQYRYGGRVLFGGGVLGTALLTLLTPPMALLGVGMLILVRIVEGVAEVRARRLRTLLCRVSPIRHCTQCGLTGRRLARKRACARSLLLAATLVQLLRYR